MSHALGKISHTWKSGSHLEDWITVGKIGHTYRNMLSLEKMGYFCKSGSQLMG